MNLIRKNTVFSLLLFLFSVLLTFVILEVFLRMLGIGYGNAPANSDPVLHHSHPNNYEFRSYGPNGDYGGHMIYYDENGLSSIKPSEVRNKDSDSCRIAFLGDSATEAGQVVYKDSFVGLLDKQSNCMVKNFGVSSYSPIIYLLQWKDIENSFNPTHVFVQLHSNDIGDDENYYAMATKDENGNVIAIPGPGNDWIKKRLRKSYLTRFVRKIQLSLIWMYENRKVEKLFVEGLPEVNPNITELSSFFIKQLKDEVVLSESNFTLLVVPSKYRSVTKNYNDNLMVEFSDKWKRFSDENKIEFVDLTKDFKKESLRGGQLFFDKDIHLNKDGNAVVAEIISKQYPQLFNKE